MGKKSKGGSYQPYMIGDLYPDYTTPFGSTRYTKQSGDKPGYFTSELSPEEGESYSIRQALIKQYLGEMGTRPEERVKQIDTYKKNYSDSIMRDALPQFTGQIYEKGLGGSTAHGRGLADLYAAIARDSFFAGEDLYSRDETERLNRLNVAEGGLQNLYNRMMGITEAQQGYGNQYINREQQNQASYNAAAQYKAQQQAAKQAAMMNSLSDMAGMALYAIPGAGPFAGTAYQASKSGGYPKLYRYATGMN